MALLGALVFCVFWLKSSASAQQTDDVVVEIERAAERGDSTAQFALAIIFEVGRQRPKSLTAAVQWFQRAADSGFAPAMTQLGILYQTGTGVNTDHSKAFQLFEQAAQAGDVEGSYRMALTYVYGIGVKKSSETARRWMEAAARGGHQEAQLALGIMVRAGVGGPANHFTARRWIGSAALGPDKLVAGRAKPIAAALDQETKTKGFTSQQLVTILAVGLTLMAMDDTKIRSQQDGVGAEIDPFNPFAYDSLSSTTRKENCRFVSRSSGMGITMGTGAFFHTSSNMWTCS